MEANIVIKLFGCVLGAAGGLYLLLLRPWRPRRMLAGLTPSIDLLFVAGLALGMAALHYPTPFERVAIWLVEQTELPQMLAGVDDRIAAAEALPGQMWREWTAHFDFSGETEPEPVAAAREPGLMATTLLPAVHGVTQALLRATVYWGSLVLLAVCQVMRLVTDVTRALVARTASQPE